MDDFVEQPGGSQDSDAAATAADEIENHAVGQQDDDQSDADSQEQTDDEDEEVEIGDKKVAMPKSLAATLKAERLMHADYTRKTQEVAATRTQVDARAAQVEQQHQMSQQFIVDIAKVTAIDDQLTQYRNVDWQRAIAEDPVQAMQWQQQQRALEQQRHEAVAGITQKQQQLALNQQQETAKLVQEAEAYFGREIKGWSNERNDALAKYAAAEGIPIQLLAPAILRAPALAKVLHKAELYDQLTKKQMAKPKPASQEKPVTRIAASNAGSGPRDPSKMTDAQFAAWRRGQIKSRK